MGRQANDIIQRIVLNGSQFSAETNRIYAEMEAGARNAAERTKSQFETSFQNIQQIAARALKVPAGPNGALNLDVQGAKDAAAAADTHAAALRRVANAAEAVALKQGDTSDATRIYVQAARAAAIEAENGARGAHQQAAALDLLQLELNQTAAGTDLVIQKNRQLNAVQRGSGMAAVQTSQQFQDFFIQVQGGQSILVAGTQQLSQLMFVMQGTGGVAGKMAGILSGPWGMALVGGLSLLSLFGDKLFATEDALDEETRKIEENAAKTRLMDQAKEAYSRTADSLISKVKEETKAWEDQNRTIFENLQHRYNLQRGETRQREKLVGDNVKDISAAIVAMNKAAREVQIAQETARSAIGVDETLTAQQALAQAEERLRQKQRALSDLEKRQSELEQGVANSRRAEQDIRGEALDTRLAQKMDAERAAADKLADAYERINRAFANKSITDRERVKQRKAAQDAHDAEIKRIRAAEKAANDAGKAEQKVRLLDPVAGRVTSELGRRKPPIRGASSDHKGIDIAVPVGTGVRAGAAGVVVSVGNMGKLGKAVVVDYGDKTIATYGHLSEILVKQGQTVSAGATIARSGNTGNSTGPHLHYGVTKDGRPVNPRNVSVREGAGDRAATDAAREIVDQRKREADQQDRILAASRRQLDVEAESLRFLGLRVRGLDEQAAVEMDIARKQRDHGDRMAELTAEQRAEQSKVHPMLTAALDVFRQQGDVYAGLIEKAGDQTSLTEAQRRALDDANAAMLTQLEAAKALAKTAEERHRIEVAIARVQGRLTTADAKAEDSARSAKRIDEELAREREKSDQDRHERQRDQVYSLASFYREAMDGGTKGIVERFRAEMKDAIAEIAARYTVALLTGQKTSLGSILGDMGATSGVGGGGLLGTLAGMLGGKSKAEKFGASLMPGAEVFGAAKAGGGLLGGLGGIGSAISSALPYAAIAMAVLPMVMSLFQSPKWGSASLSLNGGVVSGAQGVGKGASEIKAATGNASSVAQGINRLAEQLGATITDIPGVTIGSWNKRARVALTQTSAPLHSKNFGPDVLKDFGEGGEQEAIQYAIEYVFTNAALDGISDASKRIIKAGGDDIASAITKALLIEDVPKRLQALLDPVGYAVDTFNKSWEKTIAALKEGGASAEQMAAAQKLYKMELEQTKTSAREASADLKDFLKSLNFGSSSPYSIRDQERMAYEAFKPFEEAILKGERIDQAKYQESAQQWLDLQRELYGSTSKYFESMDKVQSLTGKAISDIDNAKPIRVETDPWVKATATNTQTSNDLLEQLGGKVDGLAGLLEQIKGALAKGDNFIGGNPRGFAGLAAVG